MNFQALVAPPAVDRDSHHSARIARKAALSVNSDGGVLMRAALFMIFIVGANAAGAADKLMFPVAKSAEQLGHVVLQPSIAEQDHYSVNAEFPSTTVLDHYDKVFAKWVSCKTADSGWISYGDLSSGSGRFIHNNVKYWVSKDNKTAITVFLRYESKRDFDRLRPDNNRQFVGVLRHRVDDARGFLSAFHAKCPATPNTSHQGTRQHVARP